MTPWKMIPFALMGAPLSALCLTASATSALQLHFQSPDGKTTADISFDGNLNHPMEVRLRGTPFPYPSPYDHLYSPYGIKITSTSYGWLFTSSGSAPPWFSDYSSGGIPLLAAGTFHLLLNCGLDLSACVGSLGTMRMSAISTPFLGYSGAIKLTGITYPMPEVPKPAPEPLASTPEPSLVWGLLGLGGFWWQRRRKS